MTPLKRYTPLKRSTTAPKRSTKGIRKINPERAKRRQEKYQTYLRSPEWLEKKRLVRERSGGRCERKIEVVMLDVKWTTRCTRQAEVCNHKTYARFGHELLTDLEDLCGPHDAQFENARPWRQARRSHLTAALRRAEA